MHIQNKVNILLQAMGNLIVSLRGTLLCFDYCHICSLSLCGLLLSSTRLYFINSMGAPFHGSSYGTNADLKPCGALV